MNRKEKNACGNRSINATCSTTLSSENRWSVGSTLTSIKSARIIQQQCIVLFFDIFFSSFFFPKNKFLLFLLSTNGNYCFLFNNFLLDDKITEKNIELDAEKKEMHRFSRAL
jgi:hypothetical protein